MRRSGEVICHPGFIEKVDNQFVYVKIVSSSACSSCQVKGACRLAESQEKIIEVQKRQGEEYSPGKSVDVVMERSSGTRAVVLAYLIPFLIVVLSLFILITLGLDEGISALISLLLLVPYYLILHQFRKKLKKDFEFSIHFK